MLHLESPSPVASRFFAHLLRTGTATAVRFGDPIGVEDTVDIDDAAGPVLVPDELAAVEAPPPVFATIQAPVHIAQPFSRTEAIKSVREWLIHGLGTTRGVLSAWPTATGLKFASADRILLLDQQIASGHAWWWLSVFSKTLFSRRDSYTRSPNNVVYRVGGEPAMGWNWFPRGSLYGMDPGTIDAFLHFGLTVSVRHLPYTSNAPELEQQVSYCAISIYLELEAATIGVSPPVFAAMLVFDGDDYKRMHDTVTDALAPAAVPSPVASSASKNVVGAVVASQLHTFRLSDMLRQYVELRPEENRVLVQQQIQDATIDLASKIQRLATSKMIKLNMCASSIVFCPHLADSDKGDDWVLLGFGFKTADRELITGKPYCVEYDPRLCKRMAGQTEYDANCAFVLMIGILLASVRAEFGGVATLMLRALLNQDPDGMPRAGMPTMTPLAQAFGLAISKADVFRDILLRAFQHSRTERDPVPSYIFDELVEDFTDTLGQPVTALGMQARAGRPPRFHRLVLRILDIRSYTECDTGTSDELASDQAAARKQRAYLTKVIRERQERIRGRGNPPVR